MMWAAAILVGGVAMEFWAWRAGLRPVVGEAMAEASPPVDTRVSWLVAGWNVAADLVPFVDAWRTLSGTAHQLVLAVGGEDGSLARARALQAEHPELALTIVEQTVGMGKQGALRAAWPLLTGDVVYLTDMDCRPSRDVAGPLLALLAGGADVATGPVRPLPEQEAVPLVRVQWAVLRAGDRAGARPAVGLHGANTAIRRAMLERVGGFGWDAPTGTDYTLAKRVLAVGGKVWREPKSEMPTRFPERAVYVRKQARWLGTVLRYGWHYRALGDVKAVSRTLAWPWVMAALAAGGWWWSGLWALAALLLGDAVRRRAQYVRAMGARVGLGTLTSSVLADWAAGLEAIRHVARRRARWS